jgi:NAD(P)-dependent dehydrogenase (short-subunit alcohol dehydrogenase family)
MDTVVATWAHLPRVTSPRAPMPVLSASSAVARLARELRAGSPVRRASPPRASTLAPRASITTRPDADRRVALVTGSTDGIGLHTACRLAAAGHGVIVHGRDPARVAAARERVDAVAASGGGVAGAYVRDFASLDDVRGLAHDILDAHPRLHLLDNNAGVFMPKRVVTPDGFESTFQINVLAPYLLTGLLLPRLVDTVAASASADVRVLNVASISQLPSVEWDNLNAERRFTDHTSYCHSKTMMKLFSFELHERLARRGGDEAKVVALTCDPGTVNTKMLLAGWGPCGIETHQADDQYGLLTGEAFRGEAHRGGYHVNLACRSMPGEANREERERLWEALEAATGWAYLD